MTQPDELIGKMLKQYEVQALIGSGGMANVYRAFDHNLRRPVAIKVLLPSVARLPGFIDRFRQEAMLAARLNHPNIIQVYDVEPDANGISYIVEQFLSGPTLTQQIQTVRTRVQHFAPSEVIAAGRQIASALDAAHKAGIIHRDVKPDNIIRDSDGRYVLTDFGIARQMEANTSLTQTGMIVGTPEYMSPEQAQGLRLTPATDIYSLGIVLYEMVTGRVPFASTTPIQAVIDHVQTSPPPPSTLRPGLPPTLDAVFQRALAKDPTQRYATATEFVDAMQQAWTSEPPPASVGQPTIAQPPVLGGYVPPPPAPPPAVVPVAPTGQQLPPPPAGALPVSDQETQVWGSAPPPPRSAEPRVPPPPPPPPAGPPPAPDPAAGGGAVGSGRGGFPTWLAVLLGSIVTLAALVGGAFLFTQLNAGGGGVGAVPTATLPPTEVPPLPTEPPPPPTEVPPLPTEPPPPPTEIPPPPTDTPVPPPTVIPLPTDTPVPPPTDTPVPPPTDTPVPPPTDTPVPPPTEVLPPFPTLSPNAPQAPRLSLIFNSGQQIFVANTNGENAREIQRGQSPAWSPDGRHIAFHERVRGNDELFIVDSQGRNRIQITNNNVDDREPQWSPDGTRLVFWSDRDAQEQWDIFIIDLRTGEELQLTTNLAGDFEPVWSPDGNRIAFTSNRDGNDEIYIYDLSSGTETNLTRRPSNEKHAAWSPNPELLAYQSDRLGNWDIFTNNPRNTNERQATDSPADDTMPAFSPNLQFLTFVSNRDGENGVFSAAPDGSAPRRLLGSNADIRNPSWSP